MAVAGIPTNLNVSQGNRQVYVAWSLVAGATSYSVKRSVDGVTFSVVGTPSTPYYLDTTVVVGTQYYYQVASVNGSGTSNYTGGTSYSVVPTPNGEMALCELRLRGQQAADRVGSNFVTLTEWNFNINQSLTELYDLLITTYEDYFLAPPATFTTNGSQLQYDLPNGVLTFKDDNNSDFVAEPFYKLMGVDLAISNSNNNGMATMNKFMFGDRNKYLYPNTGGTIYGVFNMRYRIMGLKMMFSPKPAASQNIRLWYIPKLPVLLAENDISTTGISGWLEYVIVDAAIKALRKEESDCSLLLAQKAALIKRIEDSAPNRDAGQPDTITDIRGNGSGWDNGWGPGGWGGPSGGF